MRLHCFTLVIFSMPMTWDTVCTNIFILMFFTSFVKGESRRGSGCCVTMFLTTNISREEAFFVKSNCVENSGKITYQCDLEAMFICFSSSTSLYALCSSIKLLGSSNLRLRSSPRLRPQYLVSTSSSLDYAFKEKKWALAKRRKLSKKNIKTVYELHSQETAQLYLCIVWGS